MNAVLILSLALSATPQDVIISVEKDAQTAKGTRYLSLHDVREKDKKAYMSVVSFVLNSVSKKDAIVVPVFTADELAIRFNLENYGITKAAYDSLGVDKRFASVKLSAILDCSNSILRADAFIVKALSAPNYYKFLEVKDLSEFKQRAGFDAKATEADYGIVIDSKVRLNNLQMRRMVTVAGYYWEVRDCKKDFLRDLFTNEFDSIQVLASNSNGLLSYFAGNARGESQESLNAWTAFDGSNVNGSPIVRMANSCMACHASNGVMPFKELMRGLGKHVAIKFINEERAEKFKNLYGNEMPFEKDVEQYHAALTKSTEMKPDEFQQTFLQVFKRYYSDLTFQEVAAILGKSEQELTRLCKDSSDIYWIKLLVDGKISRARFEELLSE